MNQTKEFAQDARKVKAAQVQLARLVEQSSVDNIVQPEKQEYLRKILAEASKL